MDCALATGTKQVAIHNGSTTVFAAINKQGSTAYRGTVSGVALCRARGWIVLYADLDNSCLQPEQTQQSEEQPLEDILECLRCHT